MALRVRTGCKNCKRCMNSFVGEAGRVTGRGLAFVTTAGVSELAMAGTKNCGACGHKLSLHMEEVTGWKQEQAEASKSPTPKAPEVEDLVGSARFPATPADLWNALVADYSTEQIRKRDDSKHRLQVKLARTPGTPACVAKFAVEASSDGGSVLRFEFRPSLLGGAWAYDDASAVARIDERLRDESRIAIELISRVVGPPENVIPPPTIEPPLADDAGKVGASAPSLDPFEQIRRLAELRDAGILSEEEFATKKAEILARL